MNDPAFHPEHDWAQLERYVRGESTPAERGEVDARLGREPALVALLMELQALDASLSRSFTPPAAPVVPLTPTGSGGTGVPAGAGGASTGAGSSLLKFLLSGTGLVSLAAVATIATLLHFALRTPAPAVLPTDPRDAYNALVGAGFTATFPESDPRQLSLLVSNKLSQEVTFSAGEGVEYIGVRTIGGGSPLRLLVLAKVRGDEVLVVLDVAGAGSSALSGIGDAQALHMYYARRGSVEVVELSPRGEAGVLPLISVR